MTTLLKPRWCSDHDKANSVMEIDRDPNRTNLSYAVVDIVITKVNVDGTVDFQVGEVSCTGIQWSESNADLWFKCPSTFPGDSALPVLGQCGQICLSANFLQTWSISATPKWPDKAGLPGSSTPLEVWPTSILVKGCVLIGEQVSYGEVELLDPRFAQVPADMRQGQPAQQIALDGGFVELMLTEEGLGCFGVGSLKAGARVDVGPLRRAVATIQASTDARAMANAWGLVATWEQMSKRQPSLLDAETRDLLGQVLKRP